MSDEHDELRARLRAADPASSLPRSDPDRVARLLEDTMSHPQTPESSADGTRQRSPLTWLVAAAAVVIIAGVGVFAVMNQTQDSGSPAAGPEPTASTSAAGTDRAACSRGRGDLGPLPAAERGRAVRRGGRVRRHRRGDRG